MSAATLPADPRDIDATWLTAALRERLPGTRVAGIEVLELHEVTNTHARLQLSYDESGAGAPGPAPATMFCKVPPLDPARRELIARTDMGRREAMFYANLASTLDLRTPAVYVALHDERDGSFLLLLEDLVASGCDVSDGTWGIPPAAAAGALEDLADLHLRFETSEARRAGAPWVPHAAPGSTYGTTMLQYALDHHRDRLTDDFAAISEIYIRDAAALHDLWHTEPVTVIHSDPHIGNLFVDHGRTGFLDWGIINVGSPMRDVSYFLNMALSIGDRRAHDRQLLRHYLDVRRANGGIEIGFDAAWRSHRLHAAYTVPACCQIVTFPDGISDRRRVFAEAFLARAEAAVDDLEALAALRDAGL